MPHTSFQVRTLPMADGVARVLKLWDFGDPEASEARFRAAEAEAREAGEESFAWELRTQAARTLGLRRQFAEADSELDTVEPVLDACGPRVKIRYLLERGRVRNSSGQKPDAIPFFVQALEAAQSAGEEFLAIDAAHMLGIAEEPEQALQWNLQALQMARDAADPLAQNWKGSLLNNLGWALHDNGEFESALALFEEALAFRTTQGNPGPIRVARWCVARCKRSLRQFPEALAEQEALLAQDPGDSDGFVREEIGECLLAMGRETEARTHLARAHELLSQDPWLSANEPARLSRLKDLSSAE